MGRSPAPPGPDVFSHARPRRCVTRGSLVPRRRLQRGAGVRRQQPSSGATAMREREPGREPPDIDPLPGHPVALPALQNPVPQSRGWGCRVNSKERGNASWEKVVPGCRAVGLRHFQLPFDPWPRGGTSAGALRRVRCSGHGFPLGGRDALVSHGAARAGCGREGRRPAGTGEKAAPARSSPRGRQPFPAKGMTPQPPWKGNQGINRQKHLTPAHQRTEGCCLAVAGASPEADLPRWQHQGSRMPLSTGHLPPCKENKHLPCHP